MKRRTPLLAALLAVAAVAVGLFAATAPASTTMNFACGNVTSHAPGVFPVNDAHVFAAWDKYTPGYFSPYAVMDVPTRDVVGNYHLTCAMPTGWVITGYVLGDGSPVKIDPKYGSPYLVKGLPIPGVYPVVAPPPLTTTSGS